MIAKKRPTRAQLKAEFERATKLWQILRIALHDLRACEQAKNVTIDMFEWYDANPKHCKVCLAGAVLRQRLLPRNVQGYFRDSGNRLQDWKTDALNLLRTGNVFYAMQSGKAIALELDRTIVDYEDNRELWWEQMQQLLRDLRKARI